jgi:pimeloyl-ACP methyl ester carboxylesterase
VTDIHVGSLVAEDAGTGPPVIMIHGLGGSSNSFQTLMPAMEGYRVLRPDLPGAGRSRLRPGLPGLEGLASAVRDLLSAAGIREAHLVGHSMGTLVCQYLAAKTPKLALSLTLYGPILEPSPAARVALRERATEAQEEGMTEIADAVAQGSVSAATRDSNPIAAAFVRESLMRQDPGGYAQHCEALSSAGAADHAAIRCPVLLIAGAEDSVAPLKMVRQLVARLPGGKLEVIPDVAHWMMIEAPHRCAELLRAHLDGIEQRELK